jgi:hypothetical protein
MVSATVAATTRCVPTTMWNVLFELKAASKIIYDRTDLTRTSNDLNVEFIPNGETEEEKRTSISRYNNLVTRELCFWKLSILGSLEERRRRLMYFL